MIKGHIGTPASHKRPLYLMDFCQYSVFGQATSGLEIIDKIVSAPRDRNDRPKNPASIKKITVTEA